VKAVFPGRIADATADDQIPNAVNIGRRDCLKKCDLDGKTLNINKV
jgi:hypothetical protein